MIEGNRYRVDDMGHVEVRCEVCGELKPYREVKTYTCQMRVPEHEEPWWLDPAFAIRHKGGRVETWGKTIQVTYVEALRTVERTTCDSCRKQHGRERRPTMEF